jgi:hypothetical protein
MPLCGETPQADAQHSPEAATILLRIFNINDFPSKTSNFLAALRQNPLTIMPQRVIFSPELMPHSGNGIERKRTGNAGARQKGTRR